MIFDPGDFSQVIPGDVIFTNMSQPARVIVKTGQMILNDDCRYEHVAICVSHETGLEARPPAARFFKIEQAHPSLYFRLPLSDDQRSLIQEQSWAADFPRYSWLTYPHLASIRLGLTNEGLSSKLMTSERRICSQLVDERLTKIGYHVFDDGRVYGDVTPGDLYYRFSLDSGITAFRLDGKKNWE